MQTNPVNPDLAAAAAALRELGVPAASHSDGPNDGEIRIPLEGNGHLHVHTLAPDDSTPEGAVRLTYVIIPTAYAAGSHREIRPMEVPQDPERIAAYIRGIIRLHRLTPLPLIVTEPDAEITPAFLDLIAREANRAFWMKVGDLLPQATSTNVPADADAAVQLTQRRAIQRWVALSTTTVRRGSPDAKPAVTSWATRSS